MREMEVHKDFQPRISRRRHITQNSKNFAYHASVNDISSFFAVLTPKTARQTNSPYCEGAAKKQNNPKAFALELSRKKLYTVSFFELIYASARIDKFLLAGKERMTL